MVTSVPASRRGAWKALSVLVVSALVLNGSMAAAMAADGDPDPASGTVEVSAPAETTDAETPGTSDEGVDAPDRGEDATDTSAELDSTGGATDAAPMIDPVESVDEADGATDPAPEQPTSDDPSAEGEDGTAPAASSTGDGGADAEPAPEAVASDEVVDAPPSAAPLSDSIVAFAAGDATIRVRKAGDRLGLGQDQKASGVAGAVFEAYRKGTATDQNPVGGTPEATCTTDANGVCDLLVNSVSRRYLVVEKTPPPGYATIENIAMGSATASGTNRPYRWNVEVRAGTMTLVPKTRIQNSGSQSWPERPNPSGPLGVNDYQWANVKTNPVLPTEQCGLDIALLFDLSGSIGNNRGRIVEAGREFVRQLSGTPTSIGVFTFSVNSPKDGYEFPGPQSIADASGTATVDGWIQNLPSASGGTNWDEGLRRIATRGSNVYDLAIVITDGNPTAWAGETNTTSNVDDYDVENAVHSANWIKAQSTRVIGIGVSGTQGGLTATNLALISGPKQGDPANPQLSADYYLTTFGELANLLSRVALNGCGGTVNVQKRIAPTWPVAETTGQEPLWPFDVDQSQTYVTPRNGVTGPNGEPLTFKVTFAQGELARDVTISEPANRQSTVLVPDGTKNARCFLQGQRPLPADRLVNAGPLGFTVKNVTDKEIVSCIVVNSDAQLSAVKYDDRNGNGRRDAGEPGLPNWTMFLDTNGNSALDAGERSVSTNAQGEALFDRLEAPKSYRVCEVLQSGWFNTDPGGGAVCKTQQVNLGDAPAGPVLFGNIRAGGFTVSKLVAGPGSSFIPSGTEYPIEVSCPAPGYPKTLTLASGESQTVGPLPVGTQCTVSETDSKGAGSVAILPSPTVTVGTDSAVSVVNTYPVGNGEVTKTVTLGTGLPNGLIPAGTKYPIEVRCTFPTTPGYPRAGEPIPGFNPFTTTIDSGTPGQPGPAAGFGPLPVGSQCTVSEANSNGATEVDIQPEQPVTIPSGSTPVQVTVTNTYEPAVLKIIKVVEGANLPDDTTFRAEVTCTDGTNEQVDFSVATPGYVSNIVQGSTCTVTEVVTNGGVPTYSPDGPFPVGGPSVEVTITNTFATGSLTVTKAVDDNNTGLVPDGTAFTVNVACTFGGGTVTGFPQTVILTKPGSLSETLTDIPVGAQCAVTETNSAGASSTIIRPTQPVTITPSAQGPVEVTVTNVFRTDDFDVTKVVDDPSGRVPANTQYTAEIRCTYPDAWPASGPIPGFDPKTLTLTAGQTVSSGQLPVGATCTISETDSAGAVSNVSPGSVTVGQGTAPVVVTVTNSYPVGAIDLRKAVDDGGTSFVPIGTEYVLRVQCTYPTGFPVSGPIPGFSPLDVRVPSGSQGSPGTAVTVGAGGLPAGNTGLPVGSQCTISEPDREGADSVAFTPSDTVTITADLDDPVEVTATNTYPVGGGEVVKVTDGPLAGQYAPAGSAFLVAIVCNYPDSFPVSGAIPGYAPLIRQISAGDPGQAGTAATFGPVPLGSRCTVTETDDGGATSVDILPAQPITITEDQDPVTVTVTNTFEAAGLRITKVVTGPGGALVPDDLTYTARVTCTFDGPNGPETVFDREVDFGVGDTTVVPGPGAATGLPVGSICTVREVETNGATASVVPSGSFPLDGPDPVSVEVTNTFPAGQLTVTKALDGALAGLVPDGTTYSIGVVCELNGSRLVGYPRDLTLTTPDQLSETITGLPVGSVCYASETDTNGATPPPAFTPPGTEEFQSGPVTIVAQPQDPISITVTNTYPGASGQVVKIVDGPQASVAPEGTAFTVEVSCELPADHPAAPGAVPGYPQSLTILAGPAGQPGAPVGFGPVPVGSTCTVTETDDKGATDVVITPAQPVAIDDEQTPVEITVTNTFDDGGLTVKKVLDGPAANLVPGDVQFTVRVTCTFGGQTVYDQELPFGVGSPATVADLPVGAECTVTETDSQGAGTVAIDPTGPVTITGGQTPVEVTVTNTYPAGSVRLAKIVDGPLAGLAPEGTQFTVVVDCQLPAGFPGAPGPVPGYPTSVTIEAGPTGAPGVPVDVGPLPVGAQCSISELDSNGASETAIAPSQFTIDRADQVVDVTVTNTYNPAALEIVKRLDGPGAALVPPGTVFTAEVVCIPPAGNPAPGFNGEVTFGVGDPGIVSGQPVGSECTVTETGNLGADSVSYAPAQTVTLTGPDPVAVAVEVTNTFGAGELTVTKVVDGAGAGFVPDGTTFTAEVSCVFAGNPVAGFDPWVVDLTTPDGLTASSSVVGALPVGSECTVTETQDRGAANVDVSPAQPVTITAAAQGPVEVTVTNTFTTGELTVSKVLAGPGGALIPDGTSFTAEVACTFLGSPVAGFDPATVTLTTPGALSDTLGPLPAGAQCTVTETQDRGAASVAISPAQPVTITDGQTPVEVTITNTFQIGQLTIEKDLAGSGAQFLPDGTVFTVEVSCTFAGNPVVGFDPRTVDLTTPDELTRTVGPLPIGSKCTVTEPQDRGAQDVAIDPSGPVTISDEQSPARVRVTNTYLAGSGRVVKVVEGPLASLAPEGTQFTVAVDCQLPAGFPGAPGPVSGYPTSLTIEAGPTGQPGTAVPFGPVPVGSQCSVVETDANGATPVVVLPDQFTIERSGQVVDVTVTNTYRPAALRIIKELAGPGAALVPPGTVFTAEVVCIPPAGNPAPGFNGEVTFGVGDPGIVSDQPVGSECTVTETGNLGAAVSYAPAQTVLLEGVDPVQVDMTVTNTFGAGELTVTKVVDGAGAGFVPDGTTFTTEVSCVFAGNPVAGFDPWVVDLTTPNDLTASSSVVGDLPVGAECTVVETQDRGAANVDVSPAQPVTITAAAQGPVEVTVTNTFTTGELTVSKVLAGPGGALIPDGTSFTAEVACTFLGSPVAGFDPATVTLTTPGGLTQTVGPLPAGAQCTVTETQDRGAASVAISPAQPVTVTDGQTPVEVTITNSFNTGLLAVEKDLAGSGVQFLPDGTVFTVEVSCTFAGNPVPGFDPKQVPLTTPDQLVELLDPLPVGAVCSVTETDDQGAQGVTIDPADPITIQDRPDAVRVRVTNTFRSGELKVTKVIDGPGAGFVPAGTVFVAEVRCAYLGQPVTGFDPYVANLTAPDGLTQAVGPLPIGATCTVAETEDNGAEQAQVSPPDPVTVQGRDQDPVEVTVTNTFTTGELTVSKVLAGPGATLLPDGTEFTVEVSCDFLGSPVAGFDPATVTLTTPAALSATVGPLPTGAQCTVTEAQSQGAADVAVSPAQPVTIASGEAPVEVTVTNTFTVGDLTVTKVLAGPGAGAVPAGTTFTATVTCEFAGYPVVGFDPAVITLTVPDQLSRTLGPLPTGSTCTVAETGTGGAKEVSITPDQPVTIGDAETPVEVTVTNTFPAVPLPPITVGETCDPDNPTGQVEGSITIPPNSDFAYAIDGVPYAAGTYPFPAGTYTATAQRIPTATPSVGTLARLALESFTWTLTVPGTEVCAALTKAADPPSGQTVYTGDVVTYTVTVQNGGDAAVVGETLVDSLPDGADLIQSSVSPSTGVYDVRANTLTWTFDLPAAVGGSPSSATFSYRVRVTADSGTLINSARWVERTLTGVTEHPTKPGTTGGITDKPPAGGLTDSGAEVAGIGAAGVLAVVLGGLMIAFDRRRRRKA